MDIKLDKLCKAIHSNLYKFTLNDIKLLKITKITYSASADSSALADAAAALASQLGDAVLGLIGARLSLLKLVLYLSVLGQVNSGNLLL